eukprot:12765675-Prorocentrum_lima.AAC.1
MLPQPEREVPQVLPQQIDEALAHLGSPDDLRGLNVPTQGLRELLVSVVVHVQNQRGRQQRSKGASALDGQLVACAGHPVPNARRVVHAAILLPQVRRVKQLGDVH